MRQTVPCLACIIVTCRERGVDKKVIKKMLDEFFSGEGLFDIMKEGDDGQHYFSERLWRITAFASNGRGDREAFGKCFHSQYAKLGLKIEPQSSKRRGRVQQDHRVDELQDGILFKDLCVHERRA